MTSQSHLEDISSETVNNRLVAPLVQEGGANGSPQPTTDASSDKALVLYKRSTYTNTDETALDVGNETEVDEIEGKQGGDVVALTEEEVQQARDSLSDGTEHWIDKVILFLPRLLLDIPAEDLRLAVVLLNHKLEFRTGERALYSAYQKEDLSVCEDAIKQQKAAMRRVLATLHVRQPRGAVGRWLCRLAVYDMPNDLALNELAVDVMGLKLDLERILDRAGIERPVAPVVKRRWWQRKAARVSDTGSSA